MLTKLIPFTFPGTSGSTETLWLAVPYFAGANGLSICSGFPPRIARGITPETVRSGKNRGPLTLAHVLSGLKRITGGRCWLT